MSMECLDLAGYAPSQAPRAPKDLRWFSGSIGHLTTATREGTTSEVLQRISWEGISEG